MSEIFNLKFSFVWAPRDEWRKLTEINVSVIKSVFQPLFWYFPHSLQRTVWGISFQGEVEDILRVKVLTAWPYPATERLDKPPEMLNRSVHHLRSEISHLFSLPSSWPAAPGSARAEINLYFLSESFVQQSVSSPCNFPVDATLSSSGWRWQSGDGWPSPPTFVMRTSQPARFSVLSGQFFKVDRAAHVASRDQ